MSTPPATAGRNPFVGPRPFEIDERLYGRERELTELYYRLSGERVVLLHSPSGAGKSSLVQAGLIPQLRHRFDVWRPTRINLEPPAGDSGANRYVLSALQGFEEGIPADLRRGVGQLAKLTLTDYVMGRPRRPGAPQSVVLIFDQFEEALTVDPLATAAKHELFEQLGELLRNPAVWALFALREDYLAPLDPYARRVPTHLRNRYRIDLLDLDAARQAMVETARDGGREFPAVDRLVQDLATMKVQQPDGSFRAQTGHRVEPVLLQVACRRLWDAMPSSDLSIDAEDLRRFGDVGEALGAYYDDSVARVAGGEVAVERGVREWLDERLITAAGIRAQVLKEAETSGGLANELIARLRDSLLVRAEQRAGATWFELAHDRLIEPVRESNAAWREAHLSPVQQRASVWEKQHRPRGLLMKDQELAAGERWAADNEASLTESERRFFEESREAQGAVEQKRRQARRIRGLTITAMIVVGALGWALYLKQRASAVVIAARELAARAQTLADTEPRTAILLASEALAEPVAADDAEPPLRRALARSGGQILGEPTERFVAVDPSHRRLITSSSVGAAHLWELDRAVMVPREIAVRVDPGRIRSAALSPDRRWLAVADEPSAEVTGEARLWNLSNVGSKPSVLEHAGPITYVEISPEGHWLLTRSGGSLRIWDLRAASPALEPAVVVYDDDQVPAVTSSGFSPFGRWLSAVRTDGVVLLWDLAGDGTPRTPVPLNGHRGLTVTARFSPDGRWLATHGADAQSSVLVPSQSRAEVPGLVRRSALLWSLPVGASAVPRERFVGVEALDFSAGSDLVTIHSDRSVQQWSHRGGAFSWRRSAPACREAASELTSSPSGRWLAVHCRDGATNLVVIQDAVEVMPVIAIDAEALEAVTFVPSGRWLATRSRRDVRLWDLESSVPGSFPVVLRGHEAYVKGFAASNRWLLTWTDGDPPRVWDLASEPSGIAEPSVFRVPGGPVGAEYGRPVALSMDGRRLATAAVDGTRAWDLEHPRSGDLPVLEDTAAPTALAFTTDGRIVFVGEGGRRVRIGEVTRRAFETPVSAAAASSDQKWLVTVGTSEIPVLQALADSSSFVPMPLTRHVGGATAQFSPDSRWLITLGGGVAYLFNVEEEPSDVERLEIEGAHTAAFNRDGRWLLSGNADHRAVLWELPAGGGKPPRADDFSHGEAISAVAVSTDGRQLATGGRDGSILLWRRSDSGLERLPVLPQLHRAEVLAIAFTPGGEHLVSLGADGTVLRWSLRLEDLRELGCRAAGRNLSREEWQEYLGSERYRKTCPELPEPTD